MIQVSELQAMLDALDRAIFSGVRSVQFAAGGTAHRIDYDTVDEMRKARVDCQAAINRASGTTPSSFSLATHSRD